MLQLLKKLIGIGPKADFTALLKKGATIVDVRSKAEYQGGHIKGSINIPLDTLGHHLSQLKKDNAIITCCASGMRSAAAKNMLKANGFTQVHNGGGWQRLQGKIQSY
jgi:rhodanese-related sulfurtransferase